MVTCHDLGTDKTLLYSGFGAVAINIKCTASDVLTIIYHLTNLLLLALGGGGGGGGHDMTQQNQITAQGSIQLKIKGNMALGLQWNLYQPLIPHNASHPK